MWYITEIRLARLAADVFAYVLTSYYQVICDATVWPET
jgi:hypothetical protein